MLLVLTVIIAWPREEKIASSSCYRHRRHAKPTSRAGLTWPRPGDCMACHTTRGGVPYAGGRAIETPFGRLVAPNITSDRDTGIGSWTADDFWRALHNGKSRNGRLLYPAFPYTSYTKITRDDADALFTFMQTIPAHKAKNQEHGLRFPYNQQFMLVDWRLLYFKLSRLRRHQDPQRAMEPGVPIWSRDSVIAWPATAAAIGSAPAIPACPAG
ncbi:hypothetical protein LP420_04665 [Massilia sp. B-10]|nr:hypothetical protein LP420_04665 [Massilia sp. B-10]